MARPPRIEFANALYHVSSRGTPRGDICHDDVDRRAWLVVLAQVCKDFNWTVHAYCLMNQHFDLLVETPNANLSTGMRQLNGVYTQLINRRHGRSGPVFQGRFKAILADKDRYLLELARHVVLSPVRAGIVADAGDWTWSSHGAMLERAWRPRPLWLATEALLARFSPPDQPLNRDVAQQRYINHVCAGVRLHSVLDAVTGQVYLGDAGFVAAMRALAEQSRTGPRTRRESK